MTEKQLKELFKGNPNTTDSSSSYSFDYWKQILSFVFDKVEYFTRPNTIDVENGNVISVKQFGRINLAEGKSISIFEVEVNDSINIERNRQGLREIAAKYIDQNIAHGALVFYFSKKQTDYRFTFIAKWSEIDESTGELVAGETQKKRYTYMLGEGQSGTTAARRLLELAGQQPNINIKDVIAAFAVETLNKQFFKEYTGYYEKFWKFLAEREQFINLFTENEKTDTQKNIRDFAKKLLGRIVFLHFLQKKRWLGCPVLPTPKENDEVWEGGEIGFMCQLFDNYADKDHFYSTCLVRLFFNTLNEPNRMNNVFSVTGSRIPYLNGGLFDNDQPHTNNIDFPAHYFNDLFLFFEQYNFTIDENSPDEQEVGIDPEMLGHIFENLLEENKEKGAFYTPKEIVHYMCQESLTHYLRTHLPECTEDDSPATIALQQFIRFGDTGDRNNKKNFVVQQAKRIEKYLDAVKICDPAIGSGAFPMGMLQEIFKAKTTLDLTLDRAATKKQIIQNSIYGVDIENGAVDIARLRFWLALVVDEEAPQPLPNLDYKIMQGNSLLESFEGIDLSRVHAIARTTTIVSPQIDIFGRTKIDLQKTTDNAVLQTHNLPALITNFFSENNYRVKQELKERINLAVHEHIDYNLELWQNSVERQYNEANQDTNNPKRKKTTDKKVEDLWQQLQQLKTNRQKLHQLQNSGSKPYFLWHLFFADVFVQGGFDIVIGNPPYIQMQSDNGALASLLKNSNYKTFERMGDVYAIFYELGFNLLKYNGIHTFITSSQWLKAGYGQSLRSYFLTQDPIKLIELGPGVFKNATVDTNILISRKASNQNKLLGARVEHANELTEHRSGLMTTMTYITDSPWAILSPVKQSIKAKIARKGTQLSSWNIEIYRGILTGLNEAFIINQQKRDNFVQNHPENLEIIRPVLRGREIHRYYTQWDGGYIIATFPALHVDIDRYPAIRDYLHEFQPKISQIGEQYVDSENHTQTTRKKTTHQWFETQDPIAYYEEFKKEKIIWKRIGSHLRFSYSDEEIYCLDSTCILTGEKIKFLTAMLNSHLCQYQLFENAPKTGMGDLIISVQALEPLQVYYPSHSEESTIVQLVDRIIELTKMKLSTSFLECKIDALIFQYLGFTEEEMLHILGTFKDLSAKDRNQIQNEFWNIANNKFNLEL